MNCITSIEVEKILIPSILIFEKKVYKIQQISKKYFIRTYILEHFDNKIINIKLQTPHPNCHPLEKEFCLPEHFLGMEINEVNKKKIEFLLKTFNFDNAYFRPWNELKYVKA